MPKRKSQVNILRQDEGSKEVIAISAQDDTDSDMDDGVINNVTASTHLPPPLHIGGSSFMKLHRRLQKAGEIKSNHLQLSSSLKSQHGNRVSSSHPIIALPSDTSTGIYGSELVAPPLNYKPASGHVDEGLGKGWFNMKPAVLDESLKRDIKIIQMRNFLDPKRYGWLVTL